MKSVSSSSELCSEGEVQVRLHHLFIGGLRISVLQGEERILTSVSLMETLTRKAGSPVTPAMAKRDISFLMKRRT